MDIEIPSWMDRTSLALEFRDRNRSLINKGRLSNLEKGLAIRRLLSSELKSWDALKIDKALGQVGKAFNLKVQEKWVEGPLRGFVQIEPRMTLYSRVLENIDLAYENLRTIRYIGIGTRVGEANGVGDFTYFHLSLRNNLIFVSTNQPDPRESKPDPHRQIAVQEILGRPKDIKTPAVFRDRLDGYLERLISEYPSFYPEKVK